MIPRQHVFWLIPLLPLFLGGGCKLSASESDGGSSGSAEQQGNDLDNMATARLSIDKTDILAWVAATHEERTKGLMFVEADRMQPREDGTERGMLFVFENEQILSFWMKDTIIPLDIAYARSDGTIVKTYTMTPLDLSGYSSLQPARFALEVNAGVFTAKGINEGEVINIPQEVLNPAN